MALTSDAPPLELMSVRLYDLPPSSTMDIYWRAVTTARIQKRVEYRIKRAFDLVLASIGLGLLAPLFVLIAVLIKVSSPGPIFYRQIRLGRDWREFTLLKFRTMVQGADQMLDDVVGLNEAHGPLFKAKKDPRITSVGKVLRAVFLDEIPQLINVVRGDMSLVGPRPCLPSETAQMEDQVIFRFAVPQGITGPWQTSGYHAVSFEERLRIERDYVTSWSFLRDLMVLIRTLPLIVQRSGV